MWLKCKPLRNSYSSGCVNWLDESAVMKPENNGRVHLGEVDHEFGFRQIEFVNPVDNPWVIPNEISDRQLDIQIWS